MRKQMWWTWSTLYHLDQLSLNVIYGKGDITGCGEAVLDRSVRFWLGKLLTKILILPGYLKETAARFIRKGVKCLCESTDKRPGAICGFREIEIVTNCFRNR
jgi:hypothetical protein